MLKNDAQTKTTYKTVYGAFISEEMGGENMQ